MRPERLISIAALAAAFLAAGAAAREEGRRPASTEFFHRNGHVSVNLPPDGSLAPAWYGDELFSMRWPGAGGPEFIGGGGFYLRFRMNGEEGWRYAGPEGFSEVEKGSEGKRLFEGCRGGRRYPAGGCDDDEDGAVDEDPFDGIDNDGDGRVDEDFRAIGHSMMVTRAGMPGTGLFLTQESYVWSFGHVRDFVGFTTRLQYLPPDPGHAPAIAALSAAQLADFDIGRSGDGGRGADDEFFMVRSDLPGFEAAQGDASSGARLPDGRGLVFAAASGGRDSEYCAAAVILGAGVRRAGTWAQQSVASPAVVPAGSDVQSLWGVFAGDGQDAEDGKEQGSSGQGERDGFTPLGGEFEVSGRGTGDFAVLDRIDEVTDLPPGSELRIDWVIVFGRSLSELAGNVERAVETYRGAPGADEKPNRWLVPARKAVRVEVKARLAPVWVQGRRMPAVSIDLPAGSNEEVEWIKVAGTRVDDFEQLGGRALANIDRALIEAGEPIFVEGQLADGTIIRALIGAGEIEAFAGDESTAPDKLPPDCLKAFPNPFVEDLSIDLTVKEAPGGSLEGSGGAASGLSSVRIYDVKGRLVRTILEEDYLDPGEYSTGWDGRDENGVRVQPGVYYCKLQIGDRSITKRLVLLR